MKRQQEIEKIIIGTLLNTFDTDWFADCCYCITADMFKDEQNSKIYSTICEYRKTNGNIITPYHICEFDSEMYTLAPYMIELAVNFDFLTKKVLFNENVWISRQLGWTRCRYTEVKFSDYVAKFIDYVILEKKMQNKAI